MMNGSELWEADWDKTGKLKRNRCVANEVTPNDYFCNCTVWKNGYTLPKSKKTLTVRVGTVKDMTDDVTQAWKRAEAGLPAQGPTYVLQFTDTATLFKYLSPKRFELLQQLKQSGPLSIRRLASQLKRDYKNVHTDAKELIAIGLIEENDDHLLIVPWDAIVTELPLLAKAK